MGNFFSKKFPTPFQNLTGKRGAHACLVPLFQVFAGMERGAFYKRLPFETCFSHSPISKQKGIRSCTEKNIRARNCAARLLST